MLLNDSNNAIDKWMILCFYLTDKQFKTSCGDYFVSSVAIFIMITCEQSLASESVKTYAKLASNVSDEVGMGIIYSLF